MTTQTSHAEWTTRDKIECALFGTVIAIALPALLIVAAQ